MREAEKPLVSLVVSFGEAPPQAMVTPLCQSLLELCRPMLDDDAATRLRLTAHELLENIAKYSAQEGCELSFELRRGASGALCASVQTRNVPIAENRDDVEARLRALTAARDPLEHYDSIIADSAGRPAGSGLGLARIHAETEYRLQHHFDGASLIIAATGEIWQKQVALP
ncbi:MAG TPA: hypothetical protein VEQ58_19920 [Polyangiaceae bacterium]|nr:hypothetical protein [Polyangiaceae bacterium]